MKSYVLVLVLVFVRSNRGKGGKGGQCLHKLELEFFKIGRQFYQLLKKNHHRFT